MKPWFQNITSGEWRWVALLTFLVVLFTGLPYLLGYLMAPEGFSYDGLHALSPGDVPIYYSYINQAKQGEYLLKDLFTTEPQALGTVNIWWALLGVFARLFDLPVALAFQLFRLFLIPVFALVAYLFLAYFFSSARRRLLAFGFLLFSSGWGFYVAGPLDLLGLEGPRSYWWPIDLWLTEAITFNAIYQTSHFIASLTLTLGIFLLLLIAFDRRRVGYALVAGVLSFLYMNFHPYYLPVIVGVPALYVFVRMLEQKKFLWRETFYVLVVAFLSLPQAVYHLWLIDQSPVIGQRALQNVTTISPLVFVLLGYGPLLIGGVLGVALIFKQKRFGHKHLFLLLWFVVNLVLMYSPFPFHSRYTQGLHVILVIFTIESLLGLGELLRARLAPKRYDFWLNNPALGLVLFVLLFAPSTLYSVGRDIYFFTVQPQAVFEKLYLPNDLFAAYDFLSSKPLGSLLLAADIPSKFAPGFSGQTVYVAHAHETLFFESKRALLLWFFSGRADDAAAWRFLQQNGISYVLWSEYEKKLGSLDLAEKPYLELVFERPLVQLFAVREVLVAPE